MWMRKKWAVSHNVGVAETENIMWAVSGLYAKYKKVSRWCNKKYCIY